MKTSISRLPAVGFVLFTALLAVAVARHYSDIPLWDMWDGYLGFYNRVLNGELTAWWDQHNEHRIVLSRLLFWVDLAFFDGKSAFLIVVNFLLAIAAALLMGVIFTEVFRDQAYTPSHWLLLTLCLTMPLSWMQEGNLTWAFQSQFFLAQLLPLVAFYSFYLGEQKQSTGWFAASLGVAIACAGTMANGIGVLPILAVIALLACRHRIRKALAYGVAAIAVWLIYFVGYRSPPGHGSVIDTLAAEPLGMLVYTGLYIGTPVHFLLDKMTPSALESSVIYLSMAAGFGLMAGALVILVKALRRPRDHVLELALLGFVAYIGATAFGTAGGRLMFGLEQALEGRYRTPAILLWLCFVVLAFRYFGPRRPSRHAVGRSAPALSVVLILLLVAQLSGATSDNRHTEFDRNLAVLALSLGVNDPDRIRQVYPWVEPAMARARQSMANGISIFSQGSRFHRLGETTAAAIADEDLHPCHGLVEGVIPVAGEAGYARIQGWLAEGQAIANHPYAVFSGDGDLRGYLLLGDTRPDLAEAVSPAAVDSGFGGYIAGQIGAEQRMTVQLEDKACWMDLPAADLAVRGPTSGE